MKHFLAIAAMAQNRVIGKGAKIPWHLPEDFRWFKRKTLGHILVMGRKTFESIGKPLPGRTTLVLSRTARQWPWPEVRSITDLDRLDPQSDDREFFICGGAEVYAQTLPRCSDLFLTRVKREVEGDVLFPSFEDRFVLVEELADTPEFSIVHYRNRELSIGPFQ